MEAKEQKEQDPQAIGAELLNSVRDTLLKQGVLQRMKAELRAAVFTAIVGRRREEPEPMPLYEQFESAEDDLRTIGTMTLFLLKDALQALDLPFTLSTLVQEAGMDDVNMEREELAGFLGLQAPLQRGMFNDGRLESILSTLLAQRMYELATDDYGGLSRTIGEGMHEYGEEDANDDGVDNDSECKDDRGGEYNDTIAFSLAETTQRGLEGYISRVDRGNRSEEAGEAVSNAITHESMHGNTDQTDQLPAAQDHLPPVAIGSHVEYDEDDFKKDFDISGSTGNIIGASEVDSHGGHRSIEPRDTPATKGIDLTQRLRLSKEDQLMLEQALGDETDGSQEDVDYEFKVRAGGKSASLTSGRERGSPEKRRLITPEEYKSTLSSKAASQLQPSSQLDEEDVFSDVDELLEGSNPITESHDLNELSGLGRSQQAERPATDNVEQIHNAEAQDDAEGFVDIGDREHEEAETGAEAAVATDELAHHQEPEQDEFQDLESVGQQDDLHDFDDHRELEGSDHFGSPQADKFDESLHSERTTSAAQRLEGSRTFREARSNILASQSADNYDEDFEVDDEEVASAVSADPENLDMSDFSAGNQSDREDSDF